MYILTPLYRSTAQRVANTAGLLQGYNQVTKNLIALKAAWDRIEASPEVPDPVDLAIHTYIEGLYFPDEITDIMLAIDEAAATITDWGIDHPDLLAV